MDKDSLPINDEISLAVITKKLWDKRKLIAIYTFSAMVVGMLNAKFTPSEWVAQSRVFVDPRGDLRLGALSRFAGLSGLNLSGGTSEPGISPMVYEEILKSDFFIHELLKEDFYYEQVNDSINFAVYCSEYLEKPPLRKIMSFPGVLLGLFRSEKEQQETIVSEDFIRLNRKDERLYNLVRGRIRVVYDQEKSIVTLGFLVQDAWLSSQVTEYSLNYLSSYLLNFSALNEKRKLDFIEEQLAIKRGEYFQKQSELALFQDENISLDTKSSQAEEQRLLSETSLAFSVYSSLAQSYEEARINFQENLPAVKIMGKSTVPASPVSPNKLLMTVGFGAFAFFMVCFIVLVRSNLKVSSI